MTRTRYRQLAIVTTIGICFLVVAGGVVRLTGSGLGCDDWPNCNNERFIDVSTGHAAIEQLNRLLSGVIGIPTLLLTIAGFRAAPRGSGLRWPAVGVLVSVLANGVVGGMAVLGDLHPFLVQSHFMLAMVSIAFGLIAVRAASERRIPWRSASLSNPLHLLVLGVVVLTAAALATGTVVTGAGPHAGEEDVRRYGFDIGSVARIHSVTVILTVACGALLAWTVARRFKTDADLDVVVDVRRHRAGGHRVRPVLHRRPRGARRAAHRRRHPALGGHRAARPGRARRDRRCRATAGEHAGNRAFIRFTCDKRLEYRPVRSTNLTPTVQTAWLRLVLGAVVVLLGLVAVGGPAFAQEDDGGGDVADRNGRRHDRGPRRHR